MKHSDPSQHLDPGPLQALSALVDRTRPLADLVALESERLALESALAESGARLHLEYARNPADPRSQAAFLRWVHEQEAPWQRVRRSLDRAFLAACEKAPVLPPWLHRLCELRQRPVPEFDPGLEPERLELLALLGELRIELGPPVGTVPETVARGELGSADRAWRARVWQALDQGWARIAPELDRLYTRLAAPPAPAAHGQPCPAPDPLCDRVEGLLVPLLERSRRDQARRLGLASLRPWDLAHDGEGGKRLLPWRDLEGLVASAAACLDTVDPGAGDLLRTLERENLLDLEARPGKAPGAFCQTLEHTGLSVIFANGALAAEDLQTLLHEAGHAWQARLCHTLPALDLRQVSGETAEFAALGMEQLCLEAGAALWGHPRAARAWRRRHLRSALERVARGCLYHQFVRGTGPCAAGAGTRDALFARLHGQYLGAGVDWEGLEDCRARSWQQVPGLFLQPGEAPGIARAQLAALQLGRRRQVLGPGAVTQWNEALALGNSVDAEEVYRRAGCAPPESEEGFRELMAHITRELERP